MISACLLLMIVSGVVSLVLTGVMRAVGRRIGHLDRPGLRKIHDRPVPVTGGIAIFLTLVTFTLAALAAAWWLPTDTWARVAPGAVAHLDGMRAQTPMALALMVGWVILHVVGLIDDRRDLGPFAKLAAQLLAAFVLVVWFNVRLMEHAPPIVSIVLTIFWFLTIINAFNFLDNMDGLSGGVATICAAILMAAALVNGQWFIAGMLALLIGALVGFLVFNLPPASIFMGDAGSLIVGLTLAFCSVRITYYDPARGTQWWAVLTPLVVLAIPLYDLVSVTLIRLSRGASPFVGDTQHFSHRLVRRGLSRRAAVGVIWACTLATGLGGVMLGRVSGPQACLIVAQTAAVLLVLVLLERTSPTDSNDSSERPT